MMENRPNFLAMHEATLETTAIISDFLCIFNNDMLMVDFINSFKANTRISVPEMRPLIALYCNKQAQYAS